MRRYLRLREDLAAGAAHAVVLALLGLLVLLLGSTLDTLCRGRPAGLTPWARPAVWLATAILTLSVGRHLYYKCVAMRQIRREMIDLRAAFRLTGDDGGARAGNGRHRS